MIRLAERIAFMALPRSTKTASTNQYSASLRETYRVDFSIPPSMQAALDKLAQQKAELVGEEDHGDLDQTKLSSAGSSQMLAQTSQ